MSEWVSENCMYVTPIRYDWGYYKQRFRPWERGWIAAWKDESCVNPSLFLYKHWERYSCACLIPIFPMLSLLWLSSGLCRWISKQFRIFNQSKNYSLWPTLTCDQGFAFCPLSLLFLLEVYCKSCRYCNLTSVNKKRNTCIMQVE